MPRQKLIHRPRKLTIHLPEDVASRLDLFLFSPVIGRIPDGSYQKFFTGRIVDFFDMEVVEMPDGETLRMSKKDATAVRRKLARLANLEADLDSNKVYKETVAKGQQA
jgi:hypothetical protein